MSGPAWVGVGAQRSGTTWFTQLLTQHPDVCLRLDTRGFIHRKEAHRFDRTLTSGPPAVGSYKAAFTGCRAPGEFTPSYMRLPWVAPLLASAMRATAPVVVLVRDPIERFWSAYRWYLQLGQETGRPAEDALSPGILGSDLTWGGLYATLLEPWIAQFGRDRIVMVQYEAAVAEPSTAAGRVFAALGLPSATVVDPGPSETTTGAEHDRPSFVEEALRRVYAREVARLASEWDVDLALWPNFQ